jgi:hypothetical protein
VVPVKLSVGPATVQQMTGADLTIAGSLSRCGVCTSP